MIKKFLPLTLALALSLGLAAPAGASAVQHFSDVPATHWAYQQVERSYADGVMEGTGGDPAKGTGLFRPDVTLTMAQFITILGRGFYGPEVQAELDKGNASPWYAPAQAVGTAHGLFAGTKAGMEEPVSRYDMAAVMTNILRDKGFALPTQGEMAETQGEIGDFATIPANYKDAVTTVFSLDIITGTDEQGTFAGDRSVDRAQAAVLYGRLKGVLSGGGQAPAGPEQPVESEKPVTPEAPAAPSNVVGTISSIPVTLSLDTHKPIVDYWSEQSDEIKALADKDAFNAAVDTLVHSDIIINDGKHNSGYNIFYNYAVIDKTVTPEKSIVSRSLRSLFAYNARFSGKFENNFFFYSR